MLKNKENISDIIYNIKNQLLDVLNDELLKELNGLEKQVSGDFFQVLIIGEFKRGKSTFVNALCGKEILPMDVLPETATINIMLYSDEPMVEIVHKNGLKERKELSNNVLSTFSAKNSSDILNDIDYLKIGAPIKLLQNRVCIVDTPGVADLDETRTDVTYSYIPRADVVFFLLDATEPLTKTEKDFIDTAVIPLGIRDIIFILNKFDDVDEDEEEDLLEEVTLRLKKAFKYGEANADFDSIKVFPLCAREALSGKIENNAELLKESGLDAIEKEMEMMLNNSNMHEIKIKHYNNQLNVIRGKIESHLLNKKNLLMLDRDELENLSNKLDEIILSYNKNESNIDSYINKIMAIMHGIVYKSTQNFIDNLSQSIIDDVDLYSGVEFKDFVEKNLKRKIEKNIDTWINTYAPNINFMLRNMENELALSMCNYFNEKISLRANINNNGLSFASSITMKATDISNVTAQAGAVAAIGSIGLFAIAGSSLMPFISLAAVPTIRQHLIKQKLKDAKTQTIPVIKKQLSDINHKLNEDIHKYITEQCTIISANTKNAYNVLLKNIKSDVDCQLSDYNSKKKIIKQELDRIEYALNKLNDFKC